MSLSAEDKVTLIRFDREIQPVAHWGGTISPARNWTPENLYQFCNSDGWKDAKFRFVRVRQSWINDGLDVDPDCTIMDDVAPPPPVSKQTVAAAQTWPSSGYTIVSRNSKLATSTLTTLGIGPNNTYAGDQARQEHGKAPVEGLGTVSHTPQNRNLLPAHPEDYAFNPYSVFRDNGHQDTGMSKELWERGMDMLALKDAEASYELPLGLHEMDDAGTNWQVRKL